MSQKRIREDNKPESGTNLPVVSKCLAIVLIHKPGRNSNYQADETIIDVNDGNSVDNSEVGKSNNNNNNSSPGYNGKELLQDFKMRNKTCYWNPSLVESIKCLDYKGFVEPSTILVTGADIHLENLRSAWGRRVLKAPAGFLIDRIGDVNGIQMQVIPQTQFMPLPDALCNIILDLNLRRILATLEVVVEKLGQRYKEMTVPDNQLVIDALGNLIKERKVFHNGSGYFVVTPDTSRLHTSVNTSYLPSNASWLPYHPMYIPVFQGELPLLPSRAHMRSISCQVTTIEETSDEENDWKGNPEKDSAEKTCIAQQESCQQDYRKEDQNMIKCEKAETKTDLDNGTLKKPAVQKDKIKVVKYTKPAVSNLDKEKGEKTSLFSKLFSRKKKDKDKDRLLMPPPPPPIPLPQPPPQPPPPLVSSSSVITSTSGSDTMSDGKGEKEYATFSAQFPPPEWVWYQQQLEKHKRTETWVTQQSNSIAAAAARFPDPFARPPIKKKSYEHKEHLKHGSRRPALPHTQGHIDYMPMSAMSSLGDKFVDSEVVTHDNDGFVKPWPVRSENIYESFSTASSIKQHHRPSRSSDKGCQRTSENIVVFPGDITPLNSSNVYQSVRTLSPVARVDEEDSYAKLLIQPQLGPLHSTPFCGKQKDRTTYGVEGHEGRDRIYGPPEVYNKKRSHRSQRRQQRLYSFYSGHGSDISYEYKGRMPKRNSSRAQSRDSGVNCVGLGVAANNDARRTEPVYENTASKQQWYNNQQQYNNRQHQYSNQQHNKISASRCLTETRVQYEITNATEITAISTESATDSNTNSVAYKSSVTNEAYNSVVYQGSLTSEAYNSVMYGSMIDAHGAPSVICQTIPSSFQEPSEVPLPYNSLQSAFYEESKTDGVPALMSPKAARHLVESQSSPDTLIVDVVGTSSQSESEDSDSSVGMLQHVVASDLKEEATALRLNPAVVKPKCIEEKLEREVDYEECGGNRGGGDDDKQCNCCRKMQEQEMGRPGHGGSHRHLDRKPGSQPGIVPRLHGRSDRLVLDSGFSSPRNPEKTADGVEGLDQFRSSRQQNTGASIQGGAGFPPLKHQLSHDSSHTHQSSNIGSSGHHSNSDACMATGSDHQSGSVSDNGNSSSGAFSGPRDCEQTPLDKPVSRMKHGCSLNSLKSENFIGQAQPSSSSSRYDHQRILQHQQQQLRHSSAHHSRASAKYPHEDTYESSLARSKYADHSQPRVPLHPNAILAEHRPHHRSKPKQERSRSVDLLQSDSRNDLHKFGRKYHSRKYGLMDEFEVMGVL